MLQTQNCSQGSAMGALPPLPPIPLASDFVWIFFSTEKTIWRKNCPFYWFCQLWPNIRRDSLVRFVILDIFFHNGFMCAVLKCHSKIGRFFLGLIRSLNGGDVSGSNLIWKVPEREFNTYYYLHTTQCTTEDLAVVHYASIGAEKIIFITVFFLLYPTTFICQNWQMHGATISKFNT